MSSIQLTPQEAENPMRYLEGRLVKLRSTPADRMLGEAKR